ncbi:hypothetical protein MRB53_002104 [Persea americana]|uniref:Uncharacterized protein n=1 Tax=Persea americana TaxID=3435 RepID=A0ACC2MTS6_PERAE|nr:hypothetical protein MRB53_002104 [Persea americana]
MSFVEIGTFRIGFLGISSLETGNRIISTYPKKGGGGGGKESLGFGDLQRDGRSNLSCGERIGMGVVALFDASSHYSYVSL